MSEPRDGVAAYLVEVGEDGALLGPLGTFPFPEIPQIGGTVVLAEPHGARFRVAGVIYQPASAECPWEVEVVRIQSLGLGGAPPGRR